MQLAPLLDFYQTLTAQDIGRFADFYADDAYFKDPFNEVRGLGAIQGIFRHMFEQVGEPRFVVTEQLVDGAGAMLVWTFHFRLGRWRGGQPMVMHGISHLRFNDDGRVSYHRDYWDTAEELYMKMPGLGLLMRGLRQAISAPGGARRCCGR